MQRYGFIQIQYKKFRIVGNGFSIDDKILQFYMGCIKYFSLTPTTLFDHEEQLQGDAQYDIGWLIAIFNICIGIDVHSFMRVAYYFPIKKLIWERMIFQIMATHGDFVTLIWFLTQHIRHTS